MPLLEPHVCRLYSRTQHTHPLSSRSSTHLVSLITPAVVAMSTVNISDDVLEAKKGKDIDVESLSSASDNASLEVALQVQEEEGHEIKFRSCSWQKVRLYLQRSRSLS